MVVLKAATWVDPSAAARVGCWVSRWADLMVVTRVERLDAWLVGTRDVHWAERWAGQTVARSAGLSVAQTVVCSVEQSAEWLVAMKVDCSAGWSAA